MNGTRPDKIDNTELLESISESSEDSQERPASSPSSQTQSKEGFCVLLIPNHVADSTPSDDEEDEG